MYQSTQDDVLSTPQLIGLFNGFFVKTLQKESNYSFYSKEWDNFKQVLAQEPLDLTQIFQHIALLQMKIDKEKNSGKSRETTPTNKEKANENSYRSKSPVNKVPARPSVSPTASKPEMLVLKPRNENKPSFESKENKVNDSKLPKHPLGIQKTVTPDFGKVMPSSKGTSKGSYQLIRIKEKALTLRNKVFAHSSDLLKAHTLALKEQMKTESNMSLGESNLSSFEERTHLRKIAIYARQPDFKDLNQSIADIDKQIVQEELRHEQHIYTHFLVKP